MQAHHIAIAMIVLYALFTWEMHAGFAQMSRTQRIFKYVANGFLLWMGIFLFAEQKEILSHESLQVIQFAIGWMTAGVINLQVMFYSIALAFYQENQMLSESHASLPNPYR